MSWLFNHHRGSQSSRKIELLRFSRHPVYLALCSVVLLPALVSVLLGVPGARADLESGKAAYLRDDYATAYKELLPLAESGDSDARYFLSKVLYFGAGVSGRSIEEDRALSEEMLEMAAAQGHPKALRDLGDDYYFAKDFEKAFHFSLKAAQADGVSGVVTLSSMYCFGQGVPRDSLEADAWLAIGFGQFTHNVEVWEGLKCEFSITVTAEYLLLVNRRAKEITREFGLPADL